MSLPVGVAESLQRLDEGLASSEADVQSLFDLLHEHSGGEVIPEVTVFLERKKALLGHLRRDLATLPQRLGVPSS